MLHGVGIGMIHGAATQRGTPTNEERLYPN
jgi:hypothetical protein